MPIRMASRALALPALLAVLALPQPARAQAAAAPEWWRGATCYEVFVRSFADSDGDGMGDLRGLTAKLDYINDGDPAGGRDLGASCIWLMPVAQSPSYHGYDVTSYRDVERDYGTQADFREMVAQAHRRGIRVLVDFVVNHTSVEHPFFKAAALSPASPYRDWYRWSPTNPGEKGPWGQELWHRSPYSDEYYYAVFWSGMPDLNLQNPEVRAEIDRVARFWLTEMRVDGFRLDAVKHFHEPREGGHALNHPWLRDFQRTVREISPNAFTVGEVWDSTGAILPFYPDQLDSYFNFDVADAILESVRTGSAQRFLSTVERVQRVVPEGRWSPFLRNHDQTRTMTELRGDFARARVAATLMLTLPGIPFVYYGEEIGMTGDKPDPRLRTPMHWTRGPHAGFSSGTPWEPLQADSMTANVEAQDGDPASLLNHHRRLIHLRAANAALARGDFVPLQAADSGVVAYLRRLDGRAVLVVANLGERRTTGVRLASAAGVLPAGRYAATPLLGGGAASAVRVGADGALRGWAALPVLEPFASHVLELAPRD